MQLGRHHGEKHSAAYSIGHIATLKKARLGESRLVKLFLMELAARSKSDSMAMVKLEAYEVEYRALERTLL